MPKQLYKQLLILALLTVSIVVFAPQAKMLLRYYDAFTNYIEIQLTYIFNPTDFGTLMRQSLTLMLTAVVIVAIPGLCYWLIKRKQLPYIYYVIWVIWLITMTKFSVV